jgi:hypothetical protein
LRLCSKLSTIVNTVIIEKIPIVMPNNERKVLNLLAFKADHAKKKLSFNRAKNKCTT